MNELELLRLVMVEGKRTLCRRYIRMHQMAESHLAAARERNPKATFLVDQLTAAVKSYKSVLQLVNGIDTDHIRIVNDCSEPARARASHPGRHTEISVSNCPRCAQPVKTNWMERHIRSNCRHGVFKDYKGIGINQ